MATQSTPYVSVEEYLAQEDESLERHEYLNGQIFAMAGGTPAHSDIGVNILTEFRNRLRGRGCKVRGSDMRIRTDISGLFSYADAVVSCGDDLIEDNTLLNPLVIVEVLSKSTEGYDRGKKFEEYRHIKSFREYLIVAQNRPYVEHHVRADDRVWTMSEFSSLDDILRLSTLGIELPLSEIYSEILFVDSN